MTKAYRTSQLKAEPKGQSKVFVNLRSDQGSTRRQQSNAVIKIVDEDTPDEKNTFKNAKLYNKLKAKQDPFSPNKET